MAEVAMYDWDDLDQAMKDFETDPNPFEKLVEYLRSTDHLTTFDGDANSVIALDIDLRDKIGSPTIVAKRISQYEHEISIDGGTALELKLKVPPRLD